MKSSSSNLKTLTIDELKQKEKEFRKELFNLRLLASKGELSNNMAIRKLKKDIARVLTFITEKSKGGKNA